VRRLSRSNHGHERPAETQDDVRTSFSGSLLFYESGGSRNRARKGHWILRRVLVGGRHLGLSRIIVFHEKVVTATLAASSRWRRSRLNSPKKRAAEIDGTAKAAPSTSSGRQEEATGVSEARSFRQRRGINKPTPALPHAAFATWMQWRTGHYGGASLTSVRRSVLGCRETPGPPINSAEPKTPWDVHAAKVAAASREHTRYGYTSIVRVAEVGQTHRVSWSLVSSNAWWRTRALA